MQCISSIFQRGLHIALYGERGVGKTSLANILPKLMNVDKLSAVRVDCSTKDTFQSLWRKILRELKISLHESEVSDLEPEDIRYKLKDQEHLLIVIDELDRLEDDEALTALADTVKTLSDHSIDVTLMLVGVADTLVDLVGEHGSIVRSMIQIQMPRMAPDESRETIQKGLNFAELAMEEEAVETIVRMAESLPHFVQYLSYHAAHRAVANDEDRVRIAHIQGSLSEAVGFHSLMDEYRRATDSPQENIYHHVLLACAYAKRDEFGYFRPVDVCPPLSIILNRQIKIANFQKHLGALSSERRHFTLNREGEERNYRFRFSNPLLATFAKIRAVPMGLIDDAQRVRLENVPEAKTGQGQLFEQ